MQALVYVLSRLAMGSRSPPLWECPSLGASYFVVVISPLRTVTPRSRGYEDVTATYICRAKICSHIYAKYQYRQESEYEITVAIYIPTK